MNGLKPKKLIINPDVKVGDKVQCVRYVVNGVECKPDSTDSLCGLEGVVSGVNNYEKEIYISIGEDAMWHNLFLSAPQGDEWIKIS